MHFILLLTNCIFLKSSAHLIMSSNLGDANEKNTRGGV